MFELRLERVWVLAFAVLLGGCAALRHTATTGWDVPCQHAPDLVVETIQDLGYQVTGRFDPSSHAQGAITGKRTEGGHRERVSVIVKCKRSGFFGGGRDGVQVTPQPIAWEPNRSDFPERFNHRFADYVAGKAKPLPPRIAPAPEALAASFMQADAVRAELSVSLEGAGIATLKVKVRNLTDKPFLVSADLARINPIPGQVVEPMSLREVSARVAQSPVGSGRRVYRAIERSYLGHGVVEPGKELTGLLFMSRVVEGELVLPIVDPESGEVRRLSTPVSPGHPGSDAEQ